MDIHRFFKKNLLFVALAGMVACSEKDDHFDGASGGQVMDMTVAEYVTSTSGHGAFGDMLKEHGYLDSLAGNRSVTLFLPPDSELSGLGVSGDKAKELVSYHIGNTLFYRAAMEGDKEYYVKTLFNGKNIWARKEGAGMELDRKVSASGDPVICSNGIVYVLDGVLVPDKNIFEGVENLPDSEYGTLKKYMTTDSLIFDRKNSFPLGVDEFGRTVYDSIFVTDYIYRFQVGDILDENRDFTALTLSDAALEATYDRMVKRYYGSADNLPAYFDDPEQKEKIVKQILGTTLVEGKVHSKNLGDTLEATNGRKIILTKEWKDISPDKRSNGYAYDLSSVDYLMSDVMGRTQEIDGSIFGVSSYDFDMENSGELEVNRIYNNASQVAVTFKSLKPFWVEFKAKDVMAGHFRLVISGLRSETTAAKTTLDGKLLDLSYTPTGNWSEDNYENIRFDSFGDRTFRFEVNEKNEDDEYKLAINGFFFIPVRE
ncbi:hypothetical protein FUAX_50840 (plasmid) [Fulvitalea axinellae]|uniref:FAS1 domain-containing protein n=1 Tax=Fulvitalea axinellae TaxID=1182444 RepID=A0AAU9D5K4_9BACT|nr:hypothetical protein FUAX_50840 [Fulvitalea axinellae]